MEALGTDAQQREALDAAMASYPASGEALVILGQALSIPPPPSQGTEKEGAWIISLLVSMLVVLVVGLGLFELRRRGFWRQRRLSLDWLRLPAISMPAWGSRLGSRLGTRQHPMTPTSPIDLSPARPSVDVKPVVSRVKPTGGRKLGSFAPAYQRGTPEYTDSFNLTMSDGAGYAGHCGMGISESLDGDDSNVTALEVWLFDKSDIRTQTYVLASEHAHDDPDLHDRLKLRGNLILAKPGQAFTIESKSLVLEGKVVAVTYADDVEPANGAFQEVKVNLEVHLR
jgi:hypothetical protein